MKLEHSLPPTGWKSECISHFERRSVYTTLNQHKLTNIMHATNQKTKVNNIFSIVAKQYDLLNDIMSLGLHRIWKRAAINLFPIKEKQLILDLAAGTGDIAFLLTKKLTGNNKIILADINQAMLQIANQRMQKQNYSNIHIVQSDAENLPFPAETFNFVFVAFGLRNMANKNLVLQNIYKTLAPDGKLVILDMSQPKNVVLRALYLLFLFTLVPVLGLVLCRNFKGYFYLADSIYKHPKQVELQKIITNAGFKNCNYRNLSAGIAAIHVGVK